MTLHCSQRLTVPQMRKYLDHKVPANGMIVNSSRDLWLQRMVNGGFVDSEDEVVKVVGSKSKSSSIVDTGGTGNIDPPLSYSKVNLFLLCSTD